MNIYEKVQGMRCVLQDKKLKKTGKNPFAKYEYFELQDIIPSINNLMKENKVSSELAFGETLVTLVLINCEKPDEKMVFSCPMASSSLKGCQEAQNLGASITYIRRYLYINAFEIVESDTLDALPLNGSQSAPTSPQKPTEEKPDIEETESMNERAATIADIFESSKDLAELEKHATSFRYEINNKMSQGFKSWLKERYDSIKSKLKEK